MIIINPILPPKYGYVEDEVDGIRTYRNVLTGKLIDEETTRPTTEEKLQAQIDYIAMMTGVEIV